MLTSARIKLSRLGSRTVHRSIRFRSMTISTIPLIGGGDALGGMEMNNAQLQVEPRTLLVEDLRYSRATVVLHSYFANNRAIRAILLPSTLRTIGVFVFSRMESLEEIDLSGTIVETIGEGFLSNSVSVKTCRFPSTLRTLGYDCLFRTSIRHVDLSHTRIRTLPCGFLSVSPVEVLLVPSTLKEMEFDTLQLARLRRLDCNHTQLSWIGHRVLSYSPIVDVRLPVTVETIVFSAFEHTPLRKLWIGEKEVQWVNEHLLDPEVRELKLLSCVPFINCGRLCGTQLQRVDLSFARIHSLDPHVLCDNSCLEEVLLPRSLSSIGCAFSNHNPNLRSLDLRCTRVEYTWDDFLYGTPIEEIRFPDTLCSVGKRFLYGARVTT